MPNIIWLQVTLQWPDVSTVNTGYKNVGYVRGTRSVLQLSAAYATEQASWGERKGKGSTAGSNRAERDSGDDERGWTAMG
jgi:hypothetical protein